MAIFLSACQPQAVEPIQTETPLANRSADPAPTLEAASTSLPTATRTPSPEDWKNAPVIPESLSDRTREIYATGLEMVRNPQAFSKVGDCGGTPSWFLGPFDIGPSDYRLGKYQYSDEVIAYFQGSYGRDSLAVRDGFNAAAILSPIRANHKLWKRAKLHWRASFA